MTTKHCPLNDTADVAEAIGPTLDLFVKQAAPAVQKVADEVYERLLYSVQDYLKENAEWNIGGEIERCRKIEADNCKLRAMQAELVEALREVEKHFGPFADITINGQNDPDDVRVISLVRALLARIDGEQA